MPFDTRHAMLLAVPRSSCTPCLGHEALVEHKEGGMAHTYHATMSWDEEVGVWYVSDTDFPGLVAEADTQRELVHKIHQTQGG